MSTFTINKTNKEFCYWLQGYFEISHTPVITSYIVDSIELELNSISEPLGLYTSWLKKVVDFINKKNNHSMVIKHYESAIKNNLNNIFKHVIDNSYDTPHSQETLDNIHINGK